MKRRLVGIYDPFHKQDYKAKVTTLIENVYLSPKILTINWRGASAMDFNCGVNSYRCRGDMESTTEDAVTTNIKTLSETELEKVRYKLFCYVLFGLLARDDK
ncbi:hypothetical protein PPTG_17756 [Phytophthora nicotianae INRA-310]|uniref:Uncharacterized protein n=5 Tax=Phytophthora nicotianae TaxID=4792 RepID=W2PJ46_PHYN3|nr:hypothetical protein PPTG_17756 [Phytophthora nicotianae INRA-310]ETN00872.1 hypothetical protein PPTG_17756 [Phytophthora nicotianae INRA-310]